MVLPTKSGTPGLSPTGRDQLVNVIHFLLPSEEQEEHQLSTAKSSIIDRQEKVENFISNYVGARTLNSQVFHLHELTVGMFPSEQGWQCGCHVTVSASVHVLMYEEKFFC